ncbi:D-2-hydroxyacid dehydrogenase [Catellatospora tritici]|uniref:D-2-hydroxyacid dehydrogenase n=1 Tax=Catellatospora tritici TaxID=2851566 RepID=UPI001C2D1B6E|nr:D-2-hydroxyacid dehydrogenase [Catellatospora tritici]MBV1850527.1 D-2-hydroxyacid dehydrogenase [Catellatospora tritici]
MTADRPTRVRLFHGGSRAVAKQVATAWPDGELHDFGDGPDFDVALVWEADEGELARFVAAQQNLRWLHTKASGVPPQVLAALGGRGVVVTNGVGTHGPAVAEHVAALLLAHYKRLPTLLDAQRDRLWRPVAADEIRHKTIGVLGLGDLGRSTARLLTALGAVVLGLRRGPGAVAEVARTYRTAQLPEFLGQLDALVIAAPLTEQTRGLIGARELALLPGGAFLVNVGRGPVVDQDALAAALRCGHLAGAALDVFDDEPLAADSPLWALPNTIITPHCADSTVQTDERCLALLLAQIERYRRARPLDNTVDLSRGY